MKRKYSQHSEAKTEAKPEAKTMKGIKRRVVSDLYLHYRTNYMNRIIRLYRMIQYVKMLNAYKKYTNQSQVHHDVPEKNPNNIVRILNLISYDSKTITGFCHTEVDRHAVIEELYKDLRRTLNDLRWVKVMIKYAINPDTTPQCSLVILRPILSISQTL